MPVERLVQAGGGEQKQERTSREAGRGKAPSRPAEAAVFSHLHMQMTEGIKMRQEEGLPAVSLSGLSGRNPRGVVRCLETDDGHVFLQPYVTSGSHWSHPLPARRQTQTSPSWQGTLRLPGQSQPPAEGRGSEKAPLPEE